MNRLKRGLLFALAIAFSSAILPAFPARADSNRGFITKIDQLDEQKNVIAQDVTQLSDKGYIRITMQLDSFLAGDNIKELQLHMEDGQDQARMGVNKKHLLHTMQPTSGTVVVDVKIDPNTMLEGAVVFTLTAVVKTRYGDTTSYSNGYSIKYADDTPRGPVASIELLHNENVVKNNTLVVYREAYADGYYTPGARIYPATAYPANLTWQSSNPAVATIGDGYADGKSTKVNITGVGETTISAVASNGVKGEYKMVVSDTYGWQQINGTWYYLHNNGDYTYMSYYVGEDGKLSSGKKYRIVYCMMATGWNYIPDGQDKEYFDENTGALRINWFKQDGKWYFANPDKSMQSYGYVVKGWLKYGNYWYYLDKTDATMRTGWLLDGNWYYYLKPNGDMATGWIKDGGKWYYLRSGGSMAVGWVKDGGKWYYMKGNGAMATGWEQVGGKWYYLSGSGAMVTGTQKIGGKTYRFNSSGAWIG